MFIPTRFLVDQLLGFVTTTQAGAGQSAIYQAKIGLIKAAIAPSVSTILADLTPANFDGYALGAAVTWTAAFLVGGLFTSVRSGNTHYQPSGSVTPNTIYGAYLVNNAGTDLLGVEIFDNPIPLSGAADAFDYEMTITLDHRGDWGIGIAA